MTHKLRNSQTGLVSIFVTMILMIVIALIVLGFAQIAQRELRHGLDRQLSTQAFYAAESGVNDATRALKNGFTGDKTSCQPSGPPHFPANSNQISGTSVQYSCLLINQSPYDLSYSSVGLDKATLGDITTTSPIDTLKISWECVANVNCAFDDGGTNFFPEFTPAASWRNGGVPIIGVLRVAVTNLSGPSPYSRNNLDTNTLTTFLYPNTSGVSSLGWTNTAASQGRIMSGGCSVANTPLKCSVEITGIGSSHIFLNMSSIYGATHVNVSATNGSGTQLRLSGAQALVDSTGKAVDVLRRIQVRVPVRAPAAVPTPVYGVQSVNGICKALVVAPSSPLPLPGGTPAFGVEFANVALDPDCALP